MGKHLQDKGTCIKNMNFGIHMDASSLDAPPTWVCNRILLNKLLHGHMVQWIKLELVPVVLHNFLNGSLGRKKLTNVMLHVQLRNKLLCISMHLRLDVGDRQGLAACKVLDLVFHSCINTEQIHFPILLSYYLGVGHDQNDQAGL